MDKQPVAAVVGGNSLLGREVRDLLEGTPFRTRLIGADQDEVGLLTEEAGEPVVMTHLDQENLGGASVAFLCGSLESSRMAAGIIAGLPQRPSIVDLTYALEDLPGACVRAPMAEPPGFSGAAAEYIVAHPAAVVLALFLHRLQQTARVTRTISHIFEPASERGRRGLEELQQQTVNLLTFKPLPKRVYDEQVGFNMLARYGAQAPEPIETFESRIERHLASLLALHGGVTMPSIRLIQAPVLHGHSISIWAEFETDPDIAALEAALATAQIDVRGRDLDPPNAVGFAGQSGISVGAISADRNHPRACWFWVVADNIRIAAENAVAVARQVVGS